MTNTVKTKEINPQNSKYIFSFPDFPLADILNNLSPLSNDTNPIPAITIPVITAIIGVDTLSLDK